MKKIILLLCLLAAAVSVGSAYEHATAEQVNRMTYAAADTGSPFDIPVSAAFSSPNSMSRFLPLLTHAAERAHVNVFRTTLGNTNSGTPEITHFILLTGNTHLFSAFRLRNGRPLTPGESRSGDDFLSSTASGSPAQVGRIADILGGPIIEIRPLRDASKWLFFAGQYWVEAGSPGGRQLFLETFARVANHDLALTGSDRYTSASFLPQSRGAGPPPAFGVPGHALAGLLGALRIALAVVLAVVVLYGSLSRARRIAVMRLAGLSPAQIWWEVVGRFVIVVSAGGLAVVACVATALSRGTPGFTPQAVRAETVSCAVLLAASAVVGVYSARLKVAEGIKGRTHIGVVLGTNLLVKVGVLAAATLLSLGSWMNAAQILHRIDLARAQSSHAPAFEHYGLLTVANGHHLIEITHGSISTTFVKGRWLYPYVVRRGALLINAYDYEDTHPAPTGGYQATLTVNRNYLNAFPVWTPAHTRVRIPNTSSWVVLIPVSDRAEAARIRRHVTQEREQLHAHSPFPIRPRVRNQKVKIIWIADQSLQTLDPLVSPGDGNKVHNPIVQVVTLQNSTFIDRSPGAGGVDDPLKIPVGSGPGRTYTTIVPELNKLHLADQLTGLKTITSVETTHLAQLKNAMLAQVATALACLIAGILLALACLTVIFARYDRRALVRRLFGQRILPCYREWGMAMAGTLLGELALCVVAVLAQAADAAGPGVPSGLETTVPRLVIIAAAFGLMEILVSAWALQRREQRVLATALKKGN